MVQAQILSGTSDGHESAGVLLPADIRQISSDIAQEKLAFTSFVDR
jgi:hypothetical protein